MAHQAVKEDEQPCQQPDEAAHVSKQLRHMAPQAGSVGGFLALRSSGMFAAAASAFARLAAWRMSDACLRLAVSASFPNSISWVAAIIFSPRGSIKYSWAASPNL